MRQTKGLTEYVRSSKYRGSLGLPDCVEETYTLLAQGEYNRNYVFVHPVSGRKLLLRINFGSQMNLPNQIEYEYRALCLLKESGRTPLPLYVDGSLAELPYGVMVMEYLPGHTLDYSSELHCAAECLADIHSVRLPADHGLICPTSPLHAILEECEEMFRVYEESPMGDAGKKRAIRRMLNQGHGKIKDITTEQGYRCCINTELNSTNFLISGKQGRDYLIDWEKPIYGEPAQDLAHLLAPTTTFWKTDVILSRQDTEAFIEYYIEQAGARFDTAGIERRTNLYIPITCLRGITWCAMAWVQYQDPKKEIFNESTYRKLNAYLSDEFLDTIREFQKQN